MRRIDLDILRTRFDGSDSFVSKGHRIARMDKFFRRRCPEWAKHDDQVKGILLKSFPALLTNDIQRQRAARWLRIIILYFREGQSESYVAETMGLSVRKVRDLVWNIKRRVNGERCRRNYASTGKPAGRPRKTV